MDLIQVLLSTDKKRIDSVSQSQFSLFSYIEKCEVSFEYEFQLSKNTYTLDYYHFLSKKKIIVFPSFHFPLFLSKKTTFV